MENRKKNSFRRAENKRFLFVYDSVLHADDMRSSEEKKAKEIFFCLSTRIPAKQIVIITLSHIHTHKLYEIMESIAGMKQLVCLSLLAILSTGNFCLFFLRLSYYIFSVLFCQWFFFHVFKYTVPHIFRAFAVGPLQHFFSSQ